MQKTFCNYAMKEKTMYPFSSRKNRIGMLFLPILIIVLLGLPGNGFSQAFFPAPQEETTISIGALVPLTGSLVNLGNTAQAALAVALEDFEREYPTVHVNMVIEDTGADPETALAKLQSLYQAGFRIFVGPFSSEALLRVKPFADENNCILISPTSTAPSLALDDNIFRICTSDGVQSLALAKFIQSKEVDHVVFLARNDTYGQDFAVAFQSIYAEMGTLAEPIFYDTQTTDFQPLISQITNAVDTILQENSDAKVGIVAVSYDEIAEIFKAASNQDALKSLRWFGADGTARNQIISQDEISSAFAAQVQFTASMFTLETRPYPACHYLINDELLYSKINSKTANQKNTFESTIYDSFWLAGISLLLDSPDLKNDLMPLSQSFVGFKGLLFFDPFGDSMDASYGFYQYSVDGKWTIAGSYSGYVFPDGSVAYENFSSELYIPDNLDKYLKIGVLVPLSGDYADGGQLISKSLELGSIHINEILERVHTPGSKIELVVEDTATDPDTALQKIQDMYAQGIRYFIGPITSAALEKVVPFVDANGIVLLSPSSTSTALSKKDTIFRFTMNDQKQAKALAALIKDRGYSQINAIYRNDAYGSGLYSDLKAAFEELGGQLGESVSYDSNTTDFSSTVIALEQNVQNLNFNKTAIVVIAYDEISDIFSAIPDNSSLTQLQWFGTDSSALNNGLLVNEKAVEVASQLRFTASIIGVDIPQFFRLPSCVLINDIANHIGAEPRSFDIAAYECLWIYIMIMENLGWPSTLDAEQTVEALISETSGSVGLLSSLSLNENGDREFGNFVFYQVSSEDDSVEWKFYADYTFDHMSQTEKLQYADDQPASSHANWELYR
jgi:branched-chain amino acid transport system substrate-binding protein